MIDKPIFIVGINRTGSTLLKNMLNLNSKVAMIPEEMHIWDPYPWANGLLKECKKKNKEEIIELLFSKKMYGSFWKKIDNYQINKNKICSQIEKINKKKVDCKNILDIIFNQYLDSKKKERIGVKYPIHISKIRLLYLWYPDCKIIHLTRDPRAIYSSKSNDEFSTKIKEKYKFIKNFIDLLTLIRILFEYYCSKKTHEKFQNNNNYLLLKYETLISEPEKTIKNICQFLEITYEENMMLTSGKPSSHTKKISVGFDKNRLEAWRKKIKPLEKNLINLLLRNSIKKFDYEE